MKEKKPFTREKREEIVELLCNFLEEEEARKVTVLIRNDGFDPWDFFKLIIGKYKERDPYIIDVVKKSKKKKYRTSFKVFCEREENDKEKLDGKELSSDDIR